MEEREIANLQVIEMRLGGGGPNYNHCRPRTAFAIVCLNADAELDWKRGRGEPSLSRNDSVGKEARPHPNPLPQEREPDDAAREQSLSGGPCPTLAKLHPLLGERAGVRENFQSQLNRSGLGEDLGARFPVVSRSQWL